MKCLAKCIDRLVFISKRWSSIIGGKDFTNLYVTRSSTRSYLLLPVYLLDMQMRFFHSCSQKDPSSDQCTINITRHPIHVCAFSPPIHGLICRQYDSKVMIGNPRTGQFLTLPKVKNEEKRYILISCV